MIHNLFSNSVIERSIRKFFVDNLDTDQHPVTFSVNFKEPATQTGAPVYRWINIHFGSPDYTGIMARYRFYIYLLARRDADNVNLAALRDEVMELLVDLSRSDGDRRLDLYDSNWQIIGQAIMRCELESDAQVDIEDFTMYKFMNIELHYAVK